MKIVKLPYTNNSCPSVSPYLDEAVVISLHTD